MADTTPRTNRAAHLAEHSWKPGQSGNPAGRPKGARNKHSEQFFEDVHAVWQEGGKEALRRAIDEKPMEFVKMVASLVPKDLPVRHAPEEDMTDEELADCIANVERVIALLEAREEQAEGGAGEVASLSDVPVRAKPVDA